MNNENTNLGNYLLYLEFITTKLNGFFENQKEYIFCHKGCSKCCEHAQFPYTKIEFFLLKEGYNILDKKQKLIIDKKIKEIKKEKQIFEKSNPNQKFRYECPFLVNNECSVYNFRGLICRSFGLMTYDIENKKSPMVPFCAYEGLNYSQVLDLNTNRISQELFDKYDLKEQPNAYNVNYATLIDEDLARCFDFNFGESKPLIEWL